jgi:uncharacterized glyoxalase superfamily protein PhnB
MHRKFLAPLVLLCAALAFKPLVAAQSKSVEEKKTVKILRQTPILTVDAIEPNLEFYEKRLGFKRLAEVPHGDRLGFIMLEQNGNHLMMQTRASIADDLGATAADNASRQIILNAAKGNATFMFVVVDSIEAAMESMKGLKLLVPLRTTNYGMREIVVRDTAGFVIVFAQEVARQ